MQGCAKSFFAANITAFMIDLLKELSRIGVTLSLEGQRLRVRGKSEALTDSLKASLTEHRDALVQYLSESSGESISHDDFSQDLQHRYEPFALAELQHAYWLGRGPSVGLGGVATHLYIELECHDLDVERLEIALNKLIQRHEMLRAIIDTRGHQRILKSVPEFRIQVTGSDFDQSTADAAVLKTREVLSHEVRAVDQWPLFDVRLSKLPHKQSRLHVSLDLLILDALSIFLFFEDWYKHYKNPAHIPPKLDMSFRDYRIYEDSLAESPAYKADESYWLARLDSLPPPPDLPLHNETVDTSARGPFVRHEFKLSADKWQALTAQARNHGLTASSVLIAAYADTLARWSASSIFTLNTTVSIRHPVHKDINAVIGDFINLVMLEIDRSDPHCEFVDFARNVHEQLAKDLEHTLFSGVKVMREWGRRHGRVSGAVMPVVFSSGLVLGDGREVGNLEQFGKKVFSISQTPQVWLDQHVVEVEGELVLVWDSPSELFEESMISAMFDHYTSQIEALATVETCWTRNANYQALLPEVVVAPGPDELPKTLHGPFVDRALLYPEAIALQTVSITLTYGQLLGRALDIAKKIDFLTDDGPGRVAIIMNRGWEQVVSVLAALLSGNAYVPIDAALPESRITTILEQSSPVVVLTQHPSTPCGSCPQFVVQDASAETGFLDTHVLNERLKPFEESFLDKHALAYVIYTSGTTGVPKGVMIDHAGACSTLHAVAQMIDLKSDDVVLMVSSLSFDLSVFDIFATLSIGGTLVIPDSGLEHDPDHWLNLIGSYKVSVWNSAPQLMRMLADRIELLEKTSKSLSRVLLSGDWVPVNLANRIRLFANSDVRVWSLGGATEASVWSIAHEIFEVNQSDVSIPYGTALPYQSVMVLDHADRISPVGVPGRIHIGGHGLAIGYLGDPDRTAQRFAKNRWNGERLYETGDIGKYVDSSGLIEILGRDDRQVKIRGYRVELGEVESILRQCDGVAECAVTTGMSERSNSATSLVAFVVPMPGSHELARDFDKERLSSSITTSMKQQLPDYSVPAIYHVIDQIPLSINGKVDYKSLKEYADQHTSVSESSIAPRNEMEIKLLQAWQTVMPEALIGVEDNFFDLGGDSVLATQLLGEIRKCCGYPLEMHELFECLTIASLGELIAGDVHPTDSSGSSPIPTCVSDDPGTPALIQTLVWPDALRPGFERLQTYTEHLLSEAASLSMRSFPSSVEGILVTGASGWVGMHLVHTLLSNTSHPVYCLHRSNLTEVQWIDQLFSSISVAGLVPLAQWRVRLHPLIGDIAKPMLGLSEANYHKVACSVDTVFHCAANLNVLADFDVLSEINVASALEIARFCSNGRAKRIVMPAPMTHLRRVKSGALTIITDPNIIMDGTGLTSGYAHSKWAVELLWQQLAKQGFNVTIVRTSRALPSEKGLVFKPFDTCEALLHVAALTQASPIWPDSRIHGVPVNKLCDTLATYGCNALKTSTEHNGLRVCHLENPNPPSIPELIAACHVNQYKQSFPELSRDKWLSLCNLSATQLKDPITQSLAMALTQKRNGLSAADIMFAQADFGSNDHSASHLNDPAAYWSSLAEGLASMSNLNQTKGKNYEKEFSVTH